MGAYFIIYHILILTGAVLSFVAFRKGYKRFIVLAILLLLTLVVELLADFLYRANKDFTWLYHLFNVFEYSLFVIFLLANVRNNTVRKISIISIPVFILGGSFISYFFYKFSGFPGININIEGFLLFIICTYILFNLDIDSGKNLWHHPDFWICTGVLIFFGCTFFYNGVYSNIFNLDEATALQIFSVLNKPLNIILYTFTITGILCLLINRKHISQ